ncbi:hypothetical protein EDB83DRAFT_2507350 [Lactarius deliciosus]|nr:hypothetical protein EDB83DRAFT_2507350 [Lactarius deliciosus]
MMNVIGRYRELPKWRKNFKAMWKKAMRTQITMPLNERYRPDVKRFVCTCSQFVVSRFLICKHLVQQFQPVNPRFFLEVTRNRSIPFWSHPSLKPLSIAEERIETDPPTATDGDGDDTASVEGYSRLNTAGNEFDDDSDDDNVLVDTWENGGEYEKKSCKEELENHIRLIRDFCDGLEFQVRFQDPRFLRTLERDGAWFFRLARNCISRERRLNSNRAASPPTWEGPTANALFYRPRPCRDRDT